MGSESSKFAGTSIGKLQQIADILAMGVTSISVIVRPREAPMSSTETGEAPMSTTETGRRRSFLDVLVRTQVATFPDWGGGGHKAYGVLYAALKVTLVEGGFVGFKDEAHGLKFMKSLVQILYGLTMRRCATAPTDPIAGWRATAACLAPPLPTTRPWTCFVRAGTAPPLPPRLSAAVCRAARATARARLLCR